MVLISLLCIVISLSDFEVWNFYKVIHNCSQENLENIYVLLYILKSFFYYYYYCGILFYINLNATAKLIVVFFQSLYLL